MRKHGTLTRWNDDRGFGFIKPSGDAQDVFAHISAFPRDGRRPQLNPCETQWC
jgi:cold shock CspA family protein